MAHVRSVNVAVPGPNPAGGRRLSGMVKVPTPDPVLLRDPGDKRRGEGSGVVGDFVGDRRHHGGTYQAVYAVAREELDHWAAEVGRDLADGAFGENLTTVGLDVDDARLGEIWQVGTTVRLQVTGPRVPCSTFAKAMDERRWVKRFTERGRTGAYLRVLTPGEVRTGDEVVIEHRPAHHVTVPMSFRAWTTERHTLPDLLAAGDDLTPEFVEKIREYRASQL